MLTCPTSFLSHFPQYWTLHFKWSWAEPKGCIQISSANRTEKEGSILYLNVHLWKGDREKLRPWSCRCRYSQLYSLTGMTYGIFGLVSSRRAPKYCYRIEKWKTFPASRQSKAVNRIQHCLVLIQCLNHKTTVLWCFPPPWWKERFQAFQKQKIIPTCPLQKVHLVLS